MNEWRVTVHRRTFSSPSYAADTGLAEVSDRSSLRLETALNTPAKCSFDVDGASPGAALLQELTTEVMAWRGEVLMFRGVVAQTQDSLSETKHTLNVVAHDYGAVLARRYLNNATTLTYTQWDQDEIVRDLVSYATDRAGVQGPAPPPPDTFTPGSFLPLQVRRVDPAGTPRALSGVKRDRGYEGSKSIGEAITELGATQNPVTNQTPSFEVGVTPAADTAGTDYLDVFYPLRGTTTGVVLAYGSNLSSVSRSVNSSEYSNWCRVLGQSPATEGAPQVYAERWNADANDVTRIPVGLWMNTDNASDVSQQNTLDEKAAGDLERSGILRPSYSLTMRPGAEPPGLGDTVALVIRSGRLDVSATVRVLGLTYAVGDDLAGGEDIELTVGRPALDLTQLFRKMNRDVDALARR